MKLNGLCLSYHHTSPGTVGGRRFRVLRELLRQHDIELDILAFNPASQEEADTGVYTAGSFAPIRSLFATLSEMKRKLVGDSIASGPSPRKAFSDIEQSRLPEATLRRGLRSLINSFERSPDGEAGWIGQAVRRGKQLKRRYDFVISTAPPWSSHVAAVRLGRHFNCPVILDDRDPWVGSPARWTVITHPWVRRRDERVARRCYEQAAGIVCVTQSACDLHHTTWPDLDLPIVCLRNAYDPALDRLARPLTPSERLKIGYVGSFYHGRSPSIVLNTATELPDEVAGDLEFHFVGGMSETEKAAVEALNAPFNVVLHGLQAHDFCLELLLDCDLALLLAIGQPRQIPAKVYEYIGLGRPVLSISTASDATMNLLADRDWAWTVASDDSEALRQSLIEIHRLWRQHRLPGIIPDDERQAYSFTTVAEKYAAFIRSVAADTSTLDAVRATS